MKNMVLKFSGFSPVKITAIGRVKNLANQERKKWVQKVKLLGSTGA
jgi:hypothetical protein